MKVLIAAIILCSASLSFAADPQMLDLSKAIVFSPESANKQEQKAVGMLVEEIAARTQIRPLITHSTPADPTPIIFVASIDSLGDAGKTAKRPGAEGYEIFIDTSGQSPRVNVIGTDSRGVLFGVGRLLRT